MNPNLPNCSIALLNSGDVNYIFGGYGDGGVPIATEDMNKVQWGTPRCVWGKEPQCVRVCQALLPDPHHPMESLYRAGRSARIAIHPTAGANKP